jgi:hypothetical protein
VFLTETGVVADVVKTIAKRGLIDYMQYEIFAEFCKCILYTVILP